MTRCKLILLMFFIYETHSIHGQSCDESFDKMLQKCQDFVDNYEATYVIGPDTLVVSRITMPPDDLNKFIFECIKKYDFRLLKYSCVIIMKQNSEYLKVNHQDYILDDPSYAKNGFIELLRIKMKLPNNEIDYIAPMFTGEICHWIRENKKEIYDFDYVEDYLKKKNVGS